MATSTTPRLAMALAAALVLAVGVPAFADSGATQGVRGTVDAQFGVAVAPDGSISESATTIPFSIIRTRENGVEVVTIVPR